MLSDWAGALGRSWAAVIRDAPALPGVAAATLEGFQARRGDAGPWRVPGALALCLLAGLAAALGVRRLTRASTAKLDGLRPASLWSRIGIVTGRFLLQGVHLVAFVATAFIADAVVNRAVPADGTVVRYVVRSLGWTWFAVVAARFVLSPVRPYLRLCALDDRSARFLTWRIGLIFGWSAFSTGLLRWVGELGWLPGAGSLGFWFSVVFHGLVALTLWQARAGITRMVLGHGGRDDHGPAWNRFAAAWPGIAIALVVLQWLVVELFAVTGNLASLSTTALNVTLAVVLALPLVELAVRALVEAIWPGDPGQEQASAPPTGRPSSGSCAAGVPSAPSCWSSSSPGSGGWTSAIWPPRG